MQIRVQYYWKSVISTCLLSLLTILLMGIMASAKPVDIEMWVPASFADGILDVTLKRMIGEFERLHPEIKVNLQTNLPDRPARGEKYMLAAMSQTLPAIGWLAPEELPKLYNEHFIVPVDKLFERDNIDPEFWPGMWKQGFGGRQWGHPFEVGSEALMYNADRFAEAGITPPTNWDQYLVVARKLTDVQKKIYGLHPLSTSAHNVLRFLWRNGGDILSADMRKATFDNPKNVTGLQFFVDMRVNHGVAGGSYTKGTAAMIEVHAGWYEDEFPFKIGTAPVPIPSGGVRATRNYYKEVVIFKTTPEKEEAAWTFMKWFMSGENNGRWAVASGYLPVTRKALVSEPYKTYLKENPLLTPWLDELRYTRYLPPQEMIDIFQKVVDSALKGAAPATALGEWQQAAQTGLDAFRTEYPSYFTR